MSRRQSGQASLEVLALVPVLVIVALLALQLASMLAGASAAQDDARARALAATGGDGAAMVVTGTASVPAVAPLGWAPAPASVRAGIRLP